MTRTLTRTLGPLALFVLLAPLAGSQTVWVVDDDGGAGVDFTDVDPAVAAAADGDLLLLKAGSYSDLVLNGRSLSVVAEAGQLPLVAGASVRNVPAGGRVRLDGLKLWSPQEAGLQVKLNAGPVWIEDCWIQGADGDGAYSSPDWHPNGYPGVEAVGSASLTLARCTIGGGDGDDYAPVAVSTGHGGDGVTALGTFLALFDSTVVGGDAGYVLDDDAAWDGTDGGHALYVNGGELFAVGNALISGAGGTAGEDFDLFFGYSCGVGGDAGDGIYALGGALALHLADNTFQSGPAGLPYPGAPCPSGTLGVPVYAPAIPLDLMAIDGYSLVLGEPVRAGQTLTLSVQGPPSSVVLVAVAGQPGWLHLPGLGGLALVDPLGLQLIGAGVTSAGGSVGLSVPAPALAPPGAAAELFLQAVGLGLGGAPLSLGAPAGLTLLDAGL